MAYVEIKAVSKHFAAREGGTFTALEGLHLEFEEGEFISVIGHSGCGKSTVLNLVAGLDAPSTGEVRVGGALVREPSPERMVVFQNHSLLPWLTLRQNVALAVNEVHRKLPVAERKALVEKHLAMVRLTAAAERFPSQVSGGMKQRCGIARALSTRPKLLLLDEPFGALDALTRANLQDEVARIWEADRLTVLMITHDVDEALLLSDRIVMMSNGPAARVAEIMKVELPRPRVRLEAINQPSYYRQRGELIYFLNKCKKEKAKKRVVSVPGRLAPAAALGAAGGFHAAAGIGAAALNGAARLNGATLEKAELVVGFVPLLDCAPFAVAQAEGFFDRQGLKVTLSREPSWKAVSDGVREGRLDAAQMVAGMPLGQSLGLGGRAPFATCTALTLSRGGNAITLSTALQDAGVTDRASLKAYIERRGRKEAPLVLGIVHPASMHNLLLRAWLAAGGIDPDLDLTLAVIPPPQMVASLAQGNIAGYCVGEPWNLRAVRKGLGFVCATDAEIWPTHPEKVLGVSAEWARTYPQTHVALVRALLQACEWCDRPEYQRQQLPELLARAEYVGGAAEDFSTSLNGGYAGPERPASAGSPFSFSRRRANTCHNNESLWILAQMARWSMLSFPRKPEQVLADVYLQQVLAEAAVGTGIEVGSVEHSPIEIAGEAPFDGSKALEYLNSLVIHRSIAIAPESQAPQIHAA
jgi:nitrate ABC transporter ATP-binding subunit